MIDPKTGKERKLVIDQLITEVKPGGTSMYHIRTATFYKKNIS